jgi:hypothetical protein
MTYFMRIVIVERVTGTQEYNDVVNHSLNIFLVAHGYGKGYNHDGVIPQA